MSSFLSSRETERMVDQHSGIYQETNGTGALMSHRCLPPTLSKMNAITVQNKCRHRTALFDHKQVRHGQHRVRHPTGDQGMAPPAWRRHHRRRDPRPHRAQHDLDQYRRIQHETTPRTNHARQLTQKAGGLQPVRHRPPRTITPASKHNNQWPQKLRIFNCISDYAFFGKSDGFMSQSSQIFSMSLSAHS